MSKNSLKEMKTEKKTEEHKEVLDQTESNKKSNKKSSARTSSRSRGKDKELVKVKTELSEIKDKYLRLYSEFDNFRRRTAKEKLDLVSTANEDLMIELLPVIDDFERDIKSFDSDNGDVENMKEGVMLIFSKLNNVTEKKGLKGMETNPGDDFNSELHDAISHIPAPEEKFKGKIIDTIEKGYYLNDKVIRFAKVVTGA
jgi:molecular chaperone GrpE